MPGLHAQTRQYRAAQNALRFGQTREYSRYGEFPLGCHSADTQSAGEQRLVVFGHRKVLVRAGSDAACERYWRQAHP